MGDNGGGMVLNSDRDQVIATLRAHERELKSVGIARLRLFGSVARGEAGNDVDLAAEFDRALSPIDLAGLENRLSDLPGRPVDLAIGTMTGAVSSPVNTRCSYKRGGKTAWAQSGGTLPGISVAEYQGHWKRPASRV